ncbi:MAG: hypothetical protein OEU80_03535 [Deltaproteobacteria bacterium]|nr:hypothetical protein [Deltaproteobacteria bacterium]MDH3773944.1 hypothetical protein [Deltaproteobacteria bacterium]MDH3801143.1 hypothetical protein [Deltaproteobacteria bacterium]MDH3927255.1 hypothetical protein [Deltaproteobacteria bacterium]MDH3949683.1 hypothetical protein [Deltaproteobacteria bacterium]
MFLRQAQDRLPLRRTVQVRLGTYTLWLPGCTPIFVVSRQQLKLPAAGCRESSKCKEGIPFYCSSLAIPGRLRRTAGNALAAAFS